ncbi:putative protein TPRXL [Equus quagga]|uniref:putative protein TPRXL n=1 Tax=Equus quagga TaxID=89248 RepID=UPI001EE34C74|nr:putative protein TPRXL [Equus quagga]
MLRRGAGARGSGSRRPRRAASAARCQRRGRTRIGDFASEGGRRLGTRRPGSGPRVERSRRRCLGCASGARQAARPLRALVPRSRLSRSRGARCSFSSASFAASSAFSFFSSSSSSSSSFFLSSSSSSSFPTSSLSATASSSTATTPSGAPRSLQSPGRRRLGCSPLDPEPAEPELVGQTDRQIRRFLTPSAPPLLPSAAPGHGSWDRPPSTARPRTTRRHLVLISRPTLALSRNPSSHCCQENPGRRRLAPAPRPRPRG